MRESGCQPAAACECGLAACGPLVYGPPQTRTARLQFMTDRISIFSAAVHRAAVAARLQRILPAVFLLWACCSTSANDDGNQLKWDRLPDIPDALGVAAPFSGVHRNYLIVAGGANFPEPVWESDKVWHDAIYCLDLDAESPQWLDSGSLPRPVAYGASVSIPQGILCLGGNDGVRIFNTAWLLQAAEGGDSGLRVNLIELPPMPAPMAGGQAVLIGSTVYVCAGQTGSGLESAVSSFWSLETGQLDPDIPGTIESLKWETLPDLPGAPRIFPVAAAQHDGYDTCVFIASGRCPDESGDGVRFLTDHWKFNPSTKSWTKVADVPACVMAGAAFPVGQSHYVVAGGDSGENFFRTDELRDDHPGFPRRSFAYHAITDTWTDAGPIPVSHVTTTAVPFRDSWIMASGEIRPRVRSPEVYRITPVGLDVSFGAVNLTVTLAYLAITSAFGFFFAMRNRTTDDYFRGGKRIVWWAAGCSVFATMLSSLTYTGIPAKAYSQDWVYSVGNFMIPVVAVYAVRIALPFFRGIDAVSAYEYLENRFSRAVRQVASGVFICFHLFRMAIVMSLTGLALAVATPLTPAQSVLLMGVLCIFYASAGGVEAVVWTDTVQAVVLLSGAFVAFGALVLGTEGGISGYFSAGFDAGKFRVANFHFNPSDARLAFWVVVMGALGQNLSSYTSDQAVVQRYMTTASQKLAARSIYLNAVLSIVATLLFFGIGTALFTFFRSRPEALDMTLHTDQIFPFFIVSQMPVGYAGLIVAGIFAAAQSTVSTSMNSMTTALFTDFNWASRSGDESSQLRLARIMTFLFGVAGTGLGLLFIAPEIKSLFDSFIKVIGLFMGVLGGLFLLGMLTRRTHARGALFGVISALIVLILVWQRTGLQAYLYPFVGVGSCFLIGWVMSAVLPHPGTRGS